MMQFIEKETDVLVATKIIESGIDIPSVNTMIINRADKFGLAELYQLRGRVGRSTVQAYCWMVIPSPRHMTKDAMKRIQAIRELSDLGSGLRLAMRDLEIRGAGNLLGAEQSGFIDDIGFETYQRIVDEAVDELKHEEFSDVFEPGTGRGGEVELPVNPELSVELDGDALIPQSFIADDAERYDFYQRMYTATTLDEINSIFSEMRDRFGEIPEETLRLRDAIGLRMAAMPTGGSALRFESGGMRLDLPPNKETRYYDTWFEPLMYAVGQVPNVELDAKEKSLSILFEGVTDLPSAVTVLNSFTNQMKEGIKRKTVEDA
jgi:transcription-repair coupling factor (superfamily II helicase)